MRPGNATQAVQSTQRGSCAPLRRSPRTLAEVVADYVAHVRERACEHLSFYANQPSLAEALVVVASFRGPDGNWEPHQRRLAREARAAAADRIRALELGDAMTFAEVHRRVEEALGPLDGIGPLTVYDVSLRLGAVLGLPPQHVYLQRAALAGARALGLPARVDCVPVDRFPPELRRLYAWEILNLLRAYREELCNLGRKARRVA